MNIEAFRPEDIKPFLELARHEGWLVDPWEFEYLLTDFPQGCFCARHDGQPVGFVTSLAHSCSGWIGNLIVSAGFRGQGVGGELFRSARTVLEDQGATTLWLTASEDGLPLYRALGFRRCDTIIRWRGAGRQRHGGHAGGGFSTELGEHSRELDRLAWGDRRDELLSAVAGRGVLCEEQGGFLMLQPMGTGHLVGPFCGTSGAAAGRLLQCAREKVSRDDSICLDMPASNRTGVRLLRRTGFVMIGRTELMFAGRAPTYRPDVLYGLATAGSCG